MRSYKPNRKTTQLTFLAKFFGYVDFQHFPFFVFVIEFFNWRLLSAKNVKTCAVPALHCTGRYAYCRHVLNCFPFMVHHIESHWMGQTIIRFCILATEYVNKPVEILIRNGKPMTADSLTCHSSGGQFWNVNLKDKIGTCYYD